jgi:hypothetical protein
VRSPENTKPDKLHRPPLQQNGKRKRRFPDQDLVTVALKKFDQAGKKLYLLPIGSSHEF